jgi:cobyrinic acid a,c-diamide synthase
MYLSRAIVTLGGETHDMLGLVAGRAVMADRLQALGYVEVQTRDETPLGPPGTRFRGHQFRYSRMEGAAAPERYDLSLARTGARLSEGYGSGNVLGSYVHAHWSATPDVPARFVARCCASSRLP